MAIGIAVVVQGQFVHTDRAQVIARQQRLHIGESGAAVAQFHQYVAVGGGEREVVQREVAIEAQLVAALARCEMQLKLAGQLAVRYRDRQRFRCIGQIAGQVQPVQLESHHRLTTVGERLGLPIDAQRAAVHAHRQQRLHEQIGVRWQVGQERNAQLDPVDPMAALQHLVVEPDIAVVHADIGQRETGRLGMGIGRAGEALDQVGEIEVLEPVARNVQLRVLQGQLVQYRCEPEQRGPGSIDDELIHVDERRMAVRIADMQMIQLQPQRIRIQMRRADADRSAELGAEAALQLRADDRWPGEVTQQAEHHQHDAKDEQGLAHPVRAVQTVGTRA